MIRNWYGRDAALVASFKENYRLSGECWERADQGDIEGLGSCLNRYWGIKKALAPGSEPEMVGRVLAALQPWVVGASLAGAGGGGFLAAILRLSSLPLLVPEHSLQDSRGQGAGCGRCEGPGRHREGEVLPSQEGADLAPGKLPHGHGGQERAGSQCGGRGQGGAAVGSGNSGGVT